MMRVNEIFTSVQGEGSRAGLPCIFVRFTACNLRCRYCDTEYAFYEGDKVERDALVQQVANGGVKLVCVTGGEPMMQPEIVPFLTELSEQGMTVLLETGGSRPLAGVPEAVVKVVDVKTPGAFQANPTLEYAASDEFLGHHFDYSNLTTLSPRDEVKFVLTGRFDYEWAREFIREHRLNERVEAVLLSPSHGVLEPSDLVAWMLEDDLEARINLQLHKVIWGPERRGV